MAHHITRAGTRCAHQRCPQRWRQIVQCHPARRWRHARAPSAARPRAPHESFDDRAPCGPLQRHTRRHRIRWPRCVHQEGGAPRALGARRLQDQGRAGVGGLPGVVGSKRAARSSALRATAVIFEVLSWHGTRFESAVMIHLGHAMHDLPACVAADKQHRSPSVGALAHFHLHRPTSHLRRRNKERHRIAVRASCAPPRGSRRPIFRRVCWQPGVGRGWLARRTRRGGGESGRSRCGSSHRGGAPKRGALWHDRLVDHPVVVVVIVRSACLLVLARLLVELLFFTTITSGARLS